MAQRRDGDGLRSTAAGVGARLRHHHRKLHQAAERGERAPLEPLIGEANARETLEEGGELGLEPRKRRAQAEVRATPERAMEHVLARDIETASSLAAANCDPRTCTSYRSTRSRSTARS